VKYRKESSLICIYTILSRCWHIQMLYSEAMAREIKDGVNKILLFAIETPQIRRHQIPYLLSIPAAAVQTSGLIFSAS
jgi:hypothetical protein